MRNNTRLYGTSVADVEASLAQLTNGLRAMSSALDSVAAPDHWSWALAPEQLAEMTTTLHDLERKARQLHALIATKRRRPGPRQRRRYPVPDDE